MKNYWKQILMALGFGIIIIIVILVILLKILNSDNSQTSSNDGSSKSANETANVENTLQVVNSVDEEDDDEEEVTLDEISSLALQKRDNSTYLIEILDDTTFVAAYDIQKGKKKYDFDGYDYEDGIAYLLYSDDEMLYLYSYDLMAKEEKKVDEIENNYESSFAYYNGNIYYITKDNSIYKYDTSSKSGEEIKKGSNSEKIVNIQIDRDNNYIYYLDNLTNSDGTVSGAIFRISLDNNEDEKVLDCGGNATEIIFYKGYIAVSVSFDGTKTDDEGNVFNVIDNQVYVYNTENGDLWQIGNKETAEGYEKATGHVGFSENYIAYSDDEIISITDYEGNVINDELYNALDANDARSIMDIYMITPTDLLIKLDETKGNGFLKVSKIISFKEATIKSVSKNCYDVKNIK